MPAFRRVEGPQAGPAAVGILVPPGRRTVLVVRPRALDWDLLPLAPLPMSGADSPFWEVSRPQAEDLARRVTHALEAGGGRVEPLGTGDGYQIRAAVGPFVLLVCPREPGRPYRPQVFDSVAEAAAAAERVAAYLCPAANAGQELYVNSRNFAR